MPINYDIDYPKLERRCWKAEAERDALESVLRRIINDLPLNRDWLDPHLELEATSLLTAKKGE